MRPALDPTIDDRGPHHRLSVHAAGGIDDGWAIATLEFDRWGRLADLVEPASAADVFSPAERRVAARKPTLDSWAGRLVGKHAVAAVVWKATGIELSIGSIELVPRPVATCTNPYRCAQGHPLEVRLRRGPLVDHTLLVSLTHERGLAAGLAWCRRLAPTSTGLNPDVSAMSGSSLRSPLARVVGKGREVPVHESGCRRDLVLTGWPGA